MAHHVPPPQLGAEGRILEGIVTTCNPDGGLNVSPMGPIVDEQMNRLWLRPFRTSTTYQNLKRLGTGVFHITDDVMLLAQAAVGQPDPMPRTLSAVRFDGLILADACRWYAFEIESLEDSAERTSIVGRIVDQARIRDFLGFNRAKHAVVDAAILATRVHLLDAHEILGEFDRLAAPVSKTGAAMEVEALAFLRRFVEQRLSEM